MVSARRPSLEKRFEYFRIEEQRQKSRENPQNQNLPQLLYHQDEPPMIS